MENATPDYHRIYNDIINKKHPTRKEECRFLLDKQNLSVLDIIELNRKIFGLSDQMTETFNQSHRSYNKSSILKILDYQEKNKLNNMQLARHFKLSRNTVARWRKLFIAEKE
ncbi:transposase [Chryseobacterium sp. BLS98]|uniref:transposase n=1 Tax=Chryseobacterium sp. BLS98 TaxID=885586 RepID=UPI00065A9C81|nr:transposase [Chryseobacterium sp. BLS98]KMQ62244.1 transposase [Chryseobacterium sp. BLS98]